MANINKIRLSGTSYDIQDLNATKVVDITQAAYDALPSSAKTANILYNITDAEAIDISEYWTSAETQSAITEATSEKVSTSDFNTYSGSVNTALNSKASQTDLNTLSGTVTAHTANTLIHVSAEQIAAWNAKSDFSGSYNDLTNKLSAGTNVTIVDNVISAEGGGKAIEAGRGISVTTGETADTVSFDLPISADTNGSILIGVGCSANREKSFVGGQTSVGQGEGSFAFGQNCKAGQWSIAVGNGVEANVAPNSVAFGKYNKQNGDRYAADSATTLFSVGNGTNSASNTRHNAFEIRRNGDIYISSGGTDIKLQDALGGGGSSYTAGDGIDITSDVISVTGKVDTTTYNTYTAATDNRLSEDEEVTAQALNVLNDRLDEDEEVTAAALNVLNESLSGKQDTLSAGTNITIVDNVISAEGGGQTYTAGDGIDITNSVISVECDSYLDYYSDRPVKNSSLANEIDGIKDNITAHTTNATIHVTSSDKSNWNGAVSNLNTLSGTVTAHTANTTVHVTSSDKSSWNGAATNASNAVTALGGLSLVKLTQTQYDNLQNKDSNTLYVIVN